MNWDAVGAIGEIVGAVAVILTLGYLALQIRQNTAALRSTATQGGTDQVASIYHTLATDPEIAMIFVNGIDSPDELSQSEMARFFSFLMMTMFSIQNLYMQTQDKVIDESLLASWTRLMTQVSPTPGFQLFWEQRKYIFSPEFRKYLENDVFTKESDPNYSALGAAR